MDHPKTVAMWQVAGDAARAAARFARRHRRAIVVGGVVGAAACVIHSMKKSLKEVNAAPQRYCCTLYQQQQQGQILWFKSNLVVMRSRSLYRIPWCTNTLHTAVVGVLFALSRCPSCLLECNSTSILQL